MTHWTIIHNPRSWSGKSAKVWPEIAEMLRKAGISYTLHTTTHAGHAVELTRDTIALGARHLVAVGGDGTVNELLNGIFLQSSVHPSEIVLAQIPMGTGNDWRRTLGVPKQYAAAVALLKNWKEVVQDVGLVEWQEGSKVQRRYFGNIAGMGFEAVVGARANADKAAGKGGILGYIPALIGILMKYKATEVSFTIDGRPISKRSFFNIAIGICKFNGGGMKQCPDAIYDDGLFDLTIINAVPKWVVIANFPRIFTGGFVKIKYVEQYRGSKIDIVTGPETLIEVDGENLGQGNATFTTLPKALRVAVPV